jgi:hypothetical protein
LISEGLGQVALANYAGSSSEERLQAVQALQMLRNNLEKIRAFLTLSWELKFIGPNISYQLNEQLNILGRQASRWRDWLRKKS